MPYIIRVRTEREQQLEQAIAESTKGMRGRQDRLQAIYYPLLIGRGGSSRFPPGLGECVTTDHHMYRASAVALDGPVFQS